MQQRATGALAGLILLAAAASPSNSQVPPVRERLGARAGFVVSSGKLNDAYGNGGNVVLHFSERIYQQVFLDVRIGAIYMGDLQKTAIDDSLFRSTGIQSEMRLLYFSVGPELSPSIGERSIGYGTLGLGIYSVSIVLDDPGVQAFNFSDQHFGINASVGYMYRFTDNWNVDLNFSGHYVFTSDDPTDLFFVFTEGEKNPLLIEFAAGVAIDLR